jgi:hypothetical protein
MKNINLNMCLLFVATTLFYSCSTDDSSFADGLPDSVINNDPADAPPRVFEESWNGHNQVLYREFFDSNTAVYYDEEVNREVLWTRNFTSDAWEHVQRNYDNFDDEDILYSVFHSENVEAFSGNIFDESTQNNFLIDLTLPGEEFSSAGTDAILKILSELVETSAFGVDGSPASAIWKDAWSEIFIYDTYLELGMEEEAQRIYDAVLESSQSYPVADTYWFRDWFYPIYNTYAGGVTLNNFYRSLSDNFSRQGDAYERDLNMGEFVHFFSGAVGEDLQIMAEEAFGWSDDWQQELLQARTDFPNVDYPFDPTSELIDLSNNATITVSKDNDSGPESNEGSLKLIDNNLNSKFLIGGFSPNINFWMQQELGESQVANRYSITSGNDAPDRDAKSWEFLGSNDGENWLVLDTRTDETFGERNQTRDFTVSNDQAYKFYRINITANNGGNLLQISEWRVLSLQLIDPSNPADVTTAAVISVSNDNVNGAQGAEGSSKLIDGDTNSKFLAGFSSGFWMQQELSQAKVIDKFTLTSGNDAPDRDAVDWVFSGSNDGNSWSDLGSFTNEVFSDRNETREFTISNSNAFVYYRITITANNGSDAIQISEWRLKESDVIITPQDFSSGAIISVNHDNPGGAGSPEGSQKLIDMDVNTKFLVSVSQDLWMQQELTQISVVNAYSITSGGDAPDRDLKHWTLSGSNDGNAWDVLDERNDEIFSGRNETRQFEISNSTAYKYYRLTMISNNGSDGTQLSEWRLLNI